MRASHRERPAHGALEVALPCDTFEDKGRHSDATPTLRRDHQKCRGGPAHGRKRGREIVDLGPTEGWIARIKITDDSALKNLMDYAAYQKQCAEETH